MKDQDMRKFLNYNYLNSLTDQNKISNEKSLGQKKHLNKSKNTAYRIGQVNPHYNSSSPRKLAMKSNIHSFKEPSIFDELILEKHNTQQFLKLDLFLVNQKPSSTETAQFDKKLDVKEYTLRNCNENPYNSDKFKDLKTIKGNKINNDISIHNKSSRNNKSNNHTNQFPLILSQAEIIKNSESIEKSQITNTFSKIQNPKLKVDYKTNSFQINKTNNLKISDNLILKKVSDSQNSKDDNKYFLTSNLTNLKSIESSTPFKINSSLDIEKNLTVEGIQIINKRKQKKKNIRPKNSKIQSFNFSNNLSNTLFDKYSLKLDVSSKPDLRKNHL